jgi:hypothetical protein
LLHCLTALAERKEKEKESKHLVKLLCLPLALSADALENKPHFSFQHLKSLIDAPNL